MSGDRNSPHRSGPPEGPRDIPQDLDAERALLGAAILSKPALELTIKRTRTGDYYSPYHQRVRAALEGFYDQGEDRIDPVLLAGELPDDPHTGIVELISAAGVSHARLAARVADLATKRRLIATATKFGELARDPSSDAHEGIVRARELLDEVSSSNGDRSYSGLISADIAAILAGDFERDRPTMLRRSDGRALIYPGKMHSLYGEPSGGKSWVALAAAKEVLELGGAVVYIDYEDTDVGIVSRLTDNLGTDPDDVRSRFRYLGFDTPFGAAERNDLDRILDELNPDLVVIDGVAEALARDGYDEDRNADVVLWTEKLPRPIARTGAAVLMLDHVGKSKERGRGARGAVHKLAAVDGAAYELVVIRPFAQDQAGTSLLKIHKDRAGAVGPIGTDAGTVKVTPRDHGKTLEVELLSPRDPNAKPEPTKPTGLMSEAMRIIEDQGDEVLRSSLKRMMRGQEKTNERAIEYLVADGYLRETTRGRSKALRKIKDYAPGSDLEPDDELARYEEEHPELFDLDEDPFPDGF